MTLQNELDLWYKKVCTLKFIANDPLQFPRRYEKREDIEIAAFLTAVIAWGRRDMIIRNADKMLTLMGKSPYNYVMSGGYKKLKNNNRRPCAPRTQGIDYTRRSRGLCLHRTFFENDLKYFCKGFKHIYNKYENLENLFASSLDIWEGLAFFREEMAMANKGLYSRHISNPGKPDKNGSACKRLNLALRWLVRKGPVDLWVWKKIKPAALYIPLDVHVARTARNLNLLKRKSNDKKAVIELTEKLRELNPLDPVKYDFSLFGMGALKQLLTRSYNGGL